MRGASKSPGGVPKSPRGTPAVTGARTWRIEAEPSPPVVTLPRSPRYHLPRPPQEVPALLLPADDSDRVGSTELVVPDYAPVKNLEEYRKQLKERLTPRPDVNGD